MQGLAQGSQHMQALTCACGTCALHARHAWPISREDATDQNPLAVHEEGLLLMPLVRTPVKHTAHILGGNTCHWRQRTCSASVLGGSFTPGRRSSAAHCFTARSTLAAQIQASVAA